MSAFVTTLAKVSFRTLRTGAGVLLLLTAVSGPAWACDVPEIDPGSMGSALALLVGGAFLLTDRIRRK